MSIVNPVTDLADRRLVEPDVPHVLTEADAVEARNAAVTYGSDLGDYMLGRYRGAYDGTIAALAAVGKVVLQAHAELTLQRLRAFDEYAHAYRDYLWKRGR